MDVLVLKDSYGVFAVPAGDVAAPDEPVLVGHGRLFTAPELDEMRDLLAKIPLALADDRVTATERGVIRQAVADVLARLAP